MPSSDALLNTEVWMTVGTLVLAVLALFARWALRHLRRSFRLRELLDEVMPTDTDQDDKLLKRLNRRIAEAKLIRETEDVTSRPGASRMSDALITVSEALSTQLVAMKGELSSAMVKVAECEKDRDELRKRLDRQGSRLRTAEVSITAIQKIADGGQANTDTLRKVLERHQEEDRRAASSGRHD